MAIRFLADVVSEAVRRLGNPEDVAGHLGGDDFVVITTARKARTLCRRILAEFDRRQRTLCTHEDLQKGYIERQSQVSREGKYPHMNLRAAVVINEKGLFHHFLEISEAASEQLDRLRSFPGSNCYFDLIDNDIEPDANVFPKTVPQEHRQESKTMFGALAWLTSLTGDIRSSITAVDDCLQQLEQKQPDSQSHQGRNIPASMRESINRLTQIAEVLENLTTIECPLISSVPDELNLERFLGWIVDQVRDQAEQLGVAIDNRVVGTTEQVIVDGKSLAQVLLYLLRAALEMSASGDRLQIGISERNDEFIALQITIPDHYLNRQTLELVQRAAMGNRLYPARLLVQGLGGKLDITSGKQQGTIYTVIIPRRWQSWMQELNALVFATSISRKQARAELENMRQLLSSLIKSVPTEFEGSLDRLRSRVQELGILCNRSLYLAEDFSSRLEKQQDWWMQQEIEQVSTSEAILAVSSEMTQQMHATRYFFDVESAQRVAKNALLIANEFGMSQNELKELHYAALLKDLGLALSAQHMTEQMVAPTIEEAIAVAARFSPVWKALLMVPFLSKSLDIVLYRNERYDGSDGRFGIKGDNIPLGSRILAVADAFDSMTSGLSPCMTLASNQAVQEIVDGSGKCFDPDVVNAFLRTWKRKELFVALPGPDKN